VIFAFSVQDGGSASLSKKGAARQLKPDAAGMQIAALEVGAESELVLLSGGNLAVK
jgi:hypothetical protein